MSELGTLKSIKGSHGKCLVFIEQIINVNTKCSSAAQLTCESDDKNNFKCIQNLLCMWHMYFIGDIDEVDVTYYLFLQDRLIQQKRGPPLYWSKNG